MSRPPLRNLLWYWAVGAIMPLLLGQAHAETAAYQGPIESVATPDGAQLLVLNQDASQVAVVERASGKLLRTIALPAKATGLALSPDGGKLWVTSATPEGTATLLDVASGKQEATLAVGHGATAPLVTPDGKRLFVCNRFDHDVSVIDLATRQPIARASVGREPVAAAVTPDGKTVVVANLLPSDRSDSYDVAATVSLIDPASHQVTPIRLLNGTTGVHGVCVSPDGRYAFLTHILARYQMPTTQLERGWMNTNALTILDLAARKIVNTVLLDEVDLGAANPWGVAVSSDGSKLCVAHAGTGELSVVDLPALLDKLAKIPSDEATARAAGRYDPNGNYSSPTAADVPNDLAFLVGLRERVKLPGNGPRGVTLVGKTAYVCLYFSDRLAVVDLEAKPIRPTALALGPEPQLTAQRRGEMLFHDAELCFQHWQSCASCHPDARVDGLNWDLMNDGLGNPKNTKSMLLAHRTPPAMSTAVRGTAEDAVRAGITHILFSVRPEEEAAAIDEYLKALEPTPSPHLIHGQLSPSAQRGKALFESPRTGCSQCHPAPLFTDLKLHNVHSRSQYDRGDDFDTPTLVEAWRTAPYLHDGHYLTIPELLVEGHHGRPADSQSPLSPQELADLVEYVLSL